MPIELRRAYLREIRERYQEASKKQKTFILNEFCINCRYTRKYAIRVLNGIVEPRVRKPGPKPQYEAVRSLLIDLWYSLGKMCSKKLKYALPLWLPFYKQGRIDSWEKVTKELSGIGVFSLLHFFDRFREGL